MHFVEGVVVQAINDVGKMARSEAVHVSRNGAAVSALQGNAFQVVDVCDLQNGVSSAGIQHILCCSEHVNKVTYVETVVLDGVLAAVLEGLSFGVPMLSCLQPGNSVEAGLFHQYRSVHEVAGGDYVLCVTVAEH